MMSSALIEQDPANLNRGPINRGSIDRMVTSGGPPDPLILIILVILDALWVHQALGDMLSIIVSYSHFRKRSVA